LEFLLDPDVTFLNHGSYGACPAPVFERYQALQRELEHNPVEFLGAASTSRPQRRGRLWPAS
jgi:isopenicillin-N epimerase